MNNVRSLLLYTLATLAALALITFGMIAIADQQEASARVYEQAFGGAR